MTNNSETSPEESKITNSINQLKKEVGKINNTISSTQSLHNRILDIEHALEYAQKSFNHVSEQRMSTLRFFIIYIAAISYGFYELLEHESHLNLYTFLLVCASLLISIAFFCIELRNRDIKNSAENSCSKLEGILSASIVYELNQKIDKLSEQNCIEKKPNK